MVEQNKIFANEPTSIFLQNYSSWYYLKILWSLIELKAPIKEGMNEVPWLGLKSEL